ncbi:MAG: hypothetical protein IJ191_08905 [Treponema sp.]|nr:hypothetical protein [Treponema sp.]
MVKLQYGIFHLGTAYIAELKEWGWWGHHGTLLSLKPLFSIEYHYISCDTILCTASAVAVDIVLTRNTLALTAHVSALFSIGAMLIFLSTGAKKIPFAMFVVSVIISVFIITETTSDICLRCAIVWNIFVCCFQ